MPDGGAVPELAAIPGLTELWKLTQGEAAVSVAMIDGPVDLTHPCFRGADVEVVAPTWLPAQIVELRPDAPRKRLEHGTWVASVLFGQRGSEVSGLAPGCHGLLLPCLRGDISEPDPANMARAIEIAVQGGARVVLIEACIPTLSGDVDDLLKRTLCNAALDGVLVIAGSGNQGAKETCFPAASPDVLAVGAYDDDGRVYAYSNWGAEYEGHGLVAPGGNITGALPGGGTKIHHGTSCSGPIVAGVAALLISLQLQRGAPADPLSVRRVLLQTAAPCSARSTDGEPRRCIAGRLDVAAATQLVLAQLRTRRPSSAPSGVTSSSADAGADASPGLASSLLVYALGALGYDFTSQTRREAFERFMTSDGSGPTDAWDERRVLDHASGIRPTPAR
ncbi:MAG: S8 family serine peptidase [Actinobacteria bacterium]|nr:S8 family serine peptidase [Actinomycetota bacterium]